MNRVHIAVLVFYLFVHITASQNTDVCLAENEDLPCTKAEECPWFVKHRQIYSEFPKNAPEKRKTLLELKSKVCNTKPNKVCCPREDVQLLSTPPTAVPTYSTTTRDVDDTSPRWVPSGRKGECGVDISSKFIIGGNITELGEHPWAVLLGISSGQQTGKLSQKKIIWKCGGTLINRWYVVSAAHCSPSQIKMVRVGEWKLVDTSKPNRKEGIKFSKRCRRCRRFRLVNGTYDCMDSTNNQYIWPEDTSAHHAVCAPPHQDIEVDRVMKHPDYRRLQSGHVVNDILLIKLQHPVQLSDYAQPACLPIGDSIPLLEHLDERDPSREAVVVGWGKTYKEDFNETTSVASAFQQKLSLNLIKNKDCSAIWSEKYKVDLTGEIRQKNHICAGGKRGEDSCKGDSGGPLLFRESDGDPTYLLGVVSTGTTICGIGVPAIFSRVTSVVQWIVNNIN